MGFFSKPESKPKTKVYSSGPGIYVLRDFKKVRSSLFQIVSRTYRLSVWSKLRKTHGDAWQAHFKREWKVLKKHVKHLSYEDNYSHDIAVIRNKLIVIRGMIISDGQAKAEVQLINEVLEELKRAHKGQVQLR